MKQNSASKSNRSMPPSVVIPELAYPDVRGAVDWLCRCFGFTERLRIGDHRAQLLFGEGSVIITHRTGDPGALTSGSSGLSMLVRVADCDEHFEAVQRFGAHIIQPPADYPYGERQYTVEDLGGYRWTFSQTIADIDPGEWGGLLFQ
jgi:uncharacterized glyoxalase superfamily protein PhnB